MDAKTLLQGYYKATGSSPTATSSSNVNTFLQGYQTATSQTKITPKPTVTQTPVVKIAPQATNINQKPTTNVLTNITNAIKGFVINLVKPKVNIAPMSSQFQIKQPSSPTPSTPEQMISLQPNQKKLTPVQIQQVAGKSAMLTPQAKAQPISKTISNLANKVASEEVTVRGTKVGTVGNIVNDIGQFLSGAITDEQRTEFNKLDAWSKLSETTKVFGALVPLKGVSMGIEGAKDAISAIRGIIAGYGAGSVLNYAAQDPKKRSVLEAIKPNLDNLLFAYFTGSTGLPNPFEFLKKQPEVSKAQYIEARDYLKNLGVKEEVFSKPEALKKSYFELAKKYHPDVPNGNVKIFKEINNAYKVVANTFYDIAKTGDKSPIAGLLTDGEHTPEELIGKVIANKLEKTPEGKALIKVASEAQKTGQNITVSKVQPIDLTTQIKQSGGKPIMLPVDQLKGGERPLTGQVRIGGGSREKGPIQVNYNVDTKELTIENGHTRVDEALAFGRKEIQAIVTPIKSIGEGGAEVVKDFYSQPPVEGGVKEGGTTTPPLSPTAKTTGGGEVVKPTIKPQTVSVPKEQLPVGEGKLKASRLEARMKGVIGNATQQQIDELGLSTYNVMNKAETIVKASQYVVNNQEEALNVLRGKANAPKDIPPEAIYVALTELAKDDITLGTKLTSLQATALGQRISILSEINKDNPVRLGSQIYKVRAEAFKKKYGGKSIEEVSNKIAEKEIKKIRPPKLSDWGSIIKEVRCK